MKKLSILILFIIISACSSDSSTGGNKYNLTIKFSFTNLIDGFDHLSQLVVYADDIEIGRSSKKYESEKNELTVQLPEAEFSIKLVVDSFYESVWEEHTIENGYNVDCAFETTIFMRADREMQIVFDLKKGALLDYLK